MATAQEKGALGLGPDATDEEVAAAITALNEKANAADNRPNVDAIRDEIRAEVQAEAQKRINEITAQANSDVAGARTEAERLIALAKADNEAAADAPVEPVSGGTRVTIGVRAFPYYVDGEDPVTGKTQRVEKIAVRGEEVVLSDLDLRRAERFGAIGTPIDPPVEPSGEFDPETASVPEIANWLRMVKPDAESTVDAANGDSGTAQKLLEAENLATGGEPRDVVVQDLTEIIQA